MSVVSTCPRIQTLASFTLDDFLDSHEIAIVRCFAVSDREFSPRLIAHFSTLLQGSVGFGSLQWSLGLPASWFGQRLSAETRAATRRLWAFWDGYYLFRRGVGIAYSPFPAVDVDRTLVTGGIALGLSMLFNSGRPSQLWQKSVNDFGIDSTIACLDRALRIAHEVEMKAREKEQHDGNQQGRGESRTRGAPGEKPSPNNPYEVLELARHSTDDEIDAKVRELRHSNHPDRVESMDKEIWKFANARSRRINEAYDQIKKSRGGA